MSFSSFYLTRSHSDLKSKGVRPEILKTGALLHKVLLPRIIITMDNLRYNIVTEGILKNNFCYKRHFDRKFLSVIGINRKIL